MFLFNKKVDEKIIKEIERIIVDNKLEMDECYLPKDATLIFYLGGCEKLDSLYKNELENFDLPNLFNYKKTSLIDCLNEHGKVRKSFFYALNNIKQSQNLFYDDALLDFLKEKGKMFIYNYLKGFQKSAEYYKKKISKGKLPDFRELFVWKQDDKLHFLDKLFVYLDPLKIDINNIISYYQDEDIARTVLEYKDGETIKMLKFNLASFDILSKIIPFKASH
ncbi:hypothetical protein [Clostridium rectalis]|uniref:hypothetical protein n=1 Tax=Clostridium rectalis TaxID=2040295 RepID=UPI000F63DCBC|nr:hypothetical protein [Clostridium rectalis]